MQLRPTAPNGWCSDHQKGSRKAVHLALFSPWISEVGPKDTYEYLGKWQIFPGSFFLWTYFKYWIVYELKKNRVFLVKFVGSIYKRTIPRLYFCYGSLPYKMPAFNQQTHLLGNTILWEFHNCGGAAFAGSTNPGHRRRSKQKSCGIISSLFDEGNRNRFWSFTLLHGFSIEKRGPTYCKFPSWRVRAEFQCLGSVKNMVRIDSIT